MNKPQDPIRINDKEYEFDKLPLAVQKDIVSIQKIDGTLNSLAEQMDLIQMARASYIGRLNAQVKEYDNALQEQTEEGRVQENADA